MIGRAASNIWVISSGIFPFSCKYWVRLVSGSSNLESSVLFTSSMESSLISAFQKAPASYSAFSICAVLIAFFCSEVHLYIILTILSATPASMNFIASVSGFPIASATSLGDHVIVRNSRDGVLKN